MARRDYDGITGAEALELLLIHIREQLEKEGRLSASQVYHNVTLSGYFGIDSYPHEPPKEEFRVKVRAKKAVIPAVPKISNEELFFKEEHLVPDLARDLIEDAKKEAPQEDVNFITHSESRG